MGVKYDPLLGKLRTSDASGGMSIGGAVTSGTGKSVLYVDGSGNLAQDNSNFSWDASTHRLSIGTTSSVYRVNIDDTASFATTMFFNSPSGGFVGIGRSGTYIGGIGGDNSWLGGGSTNDVAFAAAQVGGKLKYYTNGSVTPSMLIDASGHVGVGTISPTATLHADGTTFLKGGIDAGDTAFFDSTVALSIKSGRTWLFNMYGNTTNPLMFLGQNGHLSLKTVTSGTNATLTVNDPNTVDNLACVHISIDATGHKGLIIQGFGTGSIQEWQNASGGILSKVNSEGVFFPVQAATVSAPTYVKGGMYFDTTLNKLMVGGATAWETVTST